MIWRQGDILIQDVEEIPPMARALKRPVLASSDSTGHRHQIKDRKLACLYSLSILGGQELYLDVTGDEADLVHPEHDTIVLKRGRYRVWRQREFSDWGNRDVID